MPKREQRGDEIEDILTPLIATFVRIEPRQDIAMHPGDRTGRFAESSPQRGQRAVVAISDQSFEPRHERVFANGFGS